MVVKGGLPVAARVVGGVLGVVMKVLKEVAVLLLVEVKRLEEGEREAEEKVEVVATAAE